MRNFYFFLTAIGIFFTTIILPQSLENRYKQYGEMIVTQLSSAPFPHPERMNGHVYKDKNYSAIEHYSDSSVAIFIPKGFKSSLGLNFVVYFHGWNNNIDSGFSQFNLIEQFSESKVNAIFVFPEGPRNAPDSFAGKMEDKDGLKNLLNDVVNFLIKNNKLNGGKINKVILAGHSGAYRAIAFSLMHGGLTRNISDVILFDALYAQTDLFFHWIDKFDGRLIDIYTDHGGTKDESESLMKNLEANKIPYLSIDETNLKFDDLKVNRVIFIHSDLEHNEVISKRNQFLEFLKSSKIPKIK
jgi:hypothetical protein